MQDLNRKMARGAFWMALMRVSVRSLSLVSTVILARLLVPADFGLVAMATSVVAILELLTAFSFDIPLIQNQDATRRHFDTAWTMNLGLYAGLTILLVVLAEPAAAFYQEDRLALLIYVLAGSFFVKGFENIGVVHFRKSLNFKRDFLLLFSKKFIGFLVTIPLAILFRSYWALIAGIVVSNVGGVVLTYLFHPFRPRFSLSAAGEMLAFSKWLIFNNAIGFFRTRSPDFVIGRMSGSSALGLFTVAYELATLPTTELVAPINRVVFPGYSKLAKDPVALRESYLNVLAVVAFVALPAGIGISAVASPFVDLVLGSKWAEAAPLVGMLAIFGAINALSTNNGSIYNAIAKPYMITALGTVNTAILLTAAIALVAKYGPIGVAVAYLGTAALFAPVSMYMIARELSINARDFVSVLWRPILSTSLMYAGIIFIEERFEIGNSFSSLIALSTLVPAGVFLYMLASLSLWTVSGRPNTVEVRLINLIVNRLRAKSPAV